MAFAYSKLIRQAALRVSAVIGGDPATVNANYATTPLTSIQIGSVDFPLTALQDAAISAVARLVQAYADVEDHPFRMNNTTQTASITHKGLIPAVDSTGKQMVGVYGAVRNTATGEVMTVQPKQLIETIIGDAQLKKTYNYFKMIGGRLYCTASATIDVVTFDEATERAKFAADGNTPLPDALFDAAWNAMGAFLVNDDSYAQQASIMAGYVANVEAGLRAGKTEFEAAK